MIIVKKRGQGVGLVVDWGKPKDRNPKDLRTRSKTRQKYLMCNYCKKKGHIKLDCFKFKNKQKAEGKGVASKEANVVDCDTMVSCV